MNNSTFMKMYKKRNRSKKLALGFSAIVIILILCLSAFTYYKNTYSPVAVHNSTELEEAISNNSYITLSAKDIYDLGIERQEARYKLGIKISENVTDNFVATPVGNKIVIISLPNDKYKEFFEKESGPYLFKGTLTDFNDKDLKSIKDFLIKDGITAEKLDASLYTSYLKYKTPLGSALDYAVFAIMIALLILCFIPTMLKSKKALKSLKNYSNGDLEIACQQIDNELSYPNIYKNGPITITQNYILTDSQQIVLGLPLKELMWAYKKSIKNKSLWGKTYSLVLVFSDKKQYELNLNKKEQCVNETLLYLEEHCPSVILGYSDELSKLLKKNANKFVEDWRDKNRHIV